MSSIDHLDVPPPRPRSHTMTNKARVALPIACALALAVGTWHAGNGSYAQARASQAKPIFLAAGEGRRVGTGETAMVFKLGGGESGSTFEVAEADIKPQGGPPVHVHDDEDEAFFVVRGTFRVKVGEQTTESGPGAFVFAPRGLPHAFLNIGKTTGALLFFTAPPGFEAFWRESAEATKGLAPGSKDVEKALGAVLAKYKKRVVGPPLSGPGLAR